MSCVFLFQRLLGPPVDPGSTAGAGEQRVSVARRRQPVQSARHVLLVLSHGDVHQRPGLTDRSTAGQFVPLLSGFIGETTNCSVSLQLVLFSLLLHHHYQDKVKGFICETLHHSVSACLQH